MISFKEFLIEEVWRNNFTHDLGNEHFVPEVSNSLNKKIKSSPKNFTHLGSFVHKKTGEQMTLIHRKTFFDKDINILNSKNERVGYFQHDDKITNKNLHVYYATIRKDYQGKGLLKDAYEHMTKQGYHVVPTEGSSYSKGAEKALERIGIPLREMVKKISPLDQKKVDQEIRRHGKASDYTSSNPLQRVIRPRGFPEAEFPHGPHKIQMTHVPSERKFIFHHIPSGHPVAIARYERNSEGVIDKIDQTKSSDYTQPALMLKAFQAIKSRHAVKLDPNKMVVTPQGQRAVDILKKRKQLEETKLLDKPTRTLEQIAQKHNWSIDKMSRQLKKGIEVEKEHTSHSDVAREIALDHLWEKPDYYLKLSKMENS